MEKLPKFIVLKMNSDNKDDEACFQVGIFDGWIYFTAYQSVPMYRPVKNGDLDWEFDNAPTKIGAAAHKAVVWNEGIKEKK